MTRVGLPKGVVKQKSLLVVERFLGVSTNPQRLSFHDHCGISFYLLKHRDIPSLLNDRMIDIGITSRDWVDESGYPSDVVQELDWCNTRISLISGVGQPVLGGLVGIRCVTEFPNIARRFFSAIAAPDATVEHISGSSEGLVPTLYNCSIDCVETGSTLRMNGLLEERIIQNSNIVMIMNRDDEQLHKAPLERLLNIVENL